MSSKRHHDVQDEMQDGFEVGPVPAVGMDGSPIIEPVRAKPPPRPRLCEAGPCLNYHRFEIQLDAEDPRARTVGTALPAGTPGVQVVPGGAVYLAPAAFHLEVHHYCYPTVGVEMRLGSLPVLQCNRWHPISNLASGHTLGSREPDRLDFLRSDEGVAYLKAVADWDAARAKEQADADEIEQLITESLATPSLNQPPAEPPTGES